ncbi:MAG: hypothetical protein UT34_C0001G0042 [candidate division WS6 bacterium GW2011_GWF2_39_15]|uniref:Putative gluconeogenesis factor n=1 Tax=candidate division WS6 bacterium GW2011_GWF2_39_15 TaxID=1619100 RepID=A0A0G0QWI7_9BACT|nr:MAG: hypothetical protein UT34_C0001G0042 [candidate division WS6 bacterium GW2011_GWF2_39_15]
MKVTAIGGGTGTTVVLKGLKDYPDVSLSVIVSMTDDGGSNAIVRDEFGLLPLSDLRKSIIALSKRNGGDILRELFMYRFSKGKGLSGHTLGNLIMIALSDITGSEVNAVKASSELFGLRGTIIPVTLDKVRLVADYSNGARVVGEHFIDESSNKSRLTKLSVDGKAQANPEAVKAILESDYIVVGPGDLYTSIIANIVIPGVSEALEKTSAKIVYVSNLMTKIGETRGFGQTDMIQEINRYIGRDVDYVMINSGKIPHKILKIYKEDGEDEIKDDIKDKAFDKTRVLKLDLLSCDPVHKQKGDQLKRSLIRHSSEKLGRELYFLFRRKTISFLSWIVRDIN